MFKTDPDLIELEDVGRAFGLLTRLPVTVDGEAAADRGARAAWAWPLVGAALGLGMGILGWVLIGLGVPALVAAGVALGAQIIVTGALHEDGLADSADGLWGGWSRDQRLDIMKDSRIGAYGVLALGLTLLLRWGALSALFSTGWIVLGPVLAGAIGRGAMVWVMHRLPNARDEGLSATVGRPPKDTMVLALGLAVGAALFLGGLPGAIAVLAAAGVAWVCRELALSKIGGQTGDILGATAILAEVAALVVFSAA